MAWSSSHGYQYDRKGRFKCCSPIDDDGMKCAGGFSKNDEKCTTGDCCAPWNDEKKIPATCSDGYTPVRSPFSCKGHIESSYRNGLYSCCPPSSLTAFKSCSGTCGHGKYAASSTASNCSNCETGQVQDESTASEYGCKACASGTIPSEEKDVCVGCAEGKYVDIDGSCASCGPGMFAESKTSSDCTSCPSGFFQPEDVSTSSGCQSCPEGFVQPKSGMSICDKCHDGHYAITKALTSCQSCADFEFTPFIGWPIPCISCSQGKHVKEMSLANELQIDTWRVAISLAYHSKISTAEKRQYLVQLSEETVCTDCEAGKFQELHAFAGQSCHFCAKGKGFVSKTQACSLCIQGQTQPLDAQAGVACQSCGTGQCEYFCFFVFLFFNFVFVFVWQILELQNHKTHKLSKTNHIILPLSNIHTYPGT